MFEILGISLQIDNARSILDGISCICTPHVIARGHLSLSSSQSLRGTRHSLSQSLSPSLTHFPNVSLLRSPTPPPEGSRNHVVAVARGSWNHAVAVAVAKGSRNHAVAVAGGCGVDLGVSPAGHEVVEWSRDLVEGCEVVPDSWGLAGPDLDHHNLKSPRPRDTCETSTTTSPKPEPIHIRTL